MINQPKPGESVPAALYRFLLPHERQLRIRRAPVALCLPLSSALGGLLAAIAVSHVSGMTTPTQVTIWILVAFLLVRLTASVLGWFNYYIAITDERLLIVSGIFNLKATSSSRPDLAAIEFEIPFFSRLFRWKYGTFTFRPAGAAATTLYFVPHAEEEYLKICRFLSGEMNEGENYLCAGSARREVQAAEARSPADPDAVPGIAGRGTPGYARRRRSHHADQAAEQIGGYGTLSCPHSTTSCNRLLPAAVVLDHG